MTPPGRIRVGIGGWDYEPWRETFYPAGLAQKRQLEYASGQVSAIEINSTYYRAQKPESYAKWRAQTPDGFMFSVKALRYATNRRVLAEAGEAVEKFLGSGVAELGEKLGPIVWQLAPTKRFDPEDLEQFFKLLPAKAGGLRLRHVLDARHESFMQPDYLALARRYRVATVHTDSPDYPCWADLTGDPVYARLMRTQSSVTTGYTNPALAAWAARARIWADGGEPADLPRVGPAAAQAGGRDVFVYFISGAKERAPAAACALLTHLKQSESA
jgi:uncharacterized protein YecE (DUF72 family)